MTTKELDMRRRQILTAITGALGAIFAGLAAIPVFGSMNESARTKNQGAPVEVDISDLAVGGIKIIEWRRKPVWILRRSQEMLNAIEKMNDKVADPDSDVLQQPDYTRNKYRSIKPEILVLVGICTHLGCSPTPTLNNNNGSGGRTADAGAGFFCACHGSLFDLAGRVLKNKPAPTNLVVPPHSFIADNRIVIGIHHEETAKT